MLSPDGRLIAARTRVGDKGTLAILLADRPTEPPKLVPLGDAILADLNWAGNKRLLLTVVAKVKYGMTDGVPVLRLLAFDLDSNRTVVLDPASKGILGGRVLYVDPTGGWGLVSSQDQAFEAPSVKRVDFITGEATVVEKSRNGVWDWYADSKGVVRGGIDYGNGRWTFWYREKAGEPLRPIRGKYTKDDAAVDKITFSQEDGAGFIVTNEKTGRFAAYKYDFKDGSVGEPLYENPDVDIGGLLLDRESGKIQGVRYQDDRWRTHWLDPEYAALQAKVDKALPDAVNQIDGMSTDRNRALIFSSGGADPGAYYLLDRKATTMHPVVAMLDRIEPEQLARVEAVNYRARDGLNIPAYLTLPRGREARDLPLIVMPHGGPFARDDWTYDPLVQFLANRGYAVLQPQFRGSTGYGKAFLEAGYGEYGRKMQDDLDDGMDWLVRSGKVDPKRVCILGSSYGGYAALWGAIRNPERYRCAVSYAGVTDLKAQLRDNRKLFTAERYFKKFRNLVTGDGKVDLATLSPLTYAARLKVPVLIGHGESDDTVQAGQSRAMVKSLTAAKADVTSVFYKDTGHDFGTSENTEDFLKRIEAFLARNNPA